ncbi:hypothetical protein [Bifidobacterium crudilactis]|uniref:hypothetical protein n=1 Tax=Bifidobacterium crudilactis TaxID=327277 RepID=UPI00235381CC|nr:hypothetical protein [Bifidobacterium crudilactis]MCI2148308.1 hypothetical protein [Bifidobacterium crudilactis]MCI2158172.1 hypothetical protein [Bifidobacterium crudilactis]
MIAEICCESVKALFDVVEFGGGFFLFFSHDFDGYGVLVMCFEEFSLFGFDFAFGFG